MQPTIGVDQGLHQDLRYTEIYCGFVGTVEFSKSLSALLKFWPICFGSK